MMVWDIQDGHLFKWRNEVYRLIDIEGDTARVRRVTTAAAEASELVENFNPYAEVEKV